VRRTPRRGAASVAPSTRRSSPFGARAPQGGSSVAGLDGDASELKDHSEDDAATGAAGDALYPKNPPLRPALISAIGGPPALPPLQKGFEEAPARRGRKRGGAQASFLGERVMTPLPPHAGARKGDNCSALGALEKPCPVGDDADQRGGSEPQGPKEGRSHRRLVGRRRAVRVNDRRSFCAISGRPHAGGPSVQVVLAPDLQVVPTDRGEPVSASRRLRYGPSAQSKAGAEPNPLNLFPGGGSDQ
jgi:hypothetical protein